MGTQASHHQTDVLVVGGGVCGAAAALCLAERGHRVTLLEQHAPGHTQGSSHGDGRIIRYTYPESEYVEMARWSFDRWRRWERKAGTTLVEKTGSWECGPADSVQLVALEDALGVAGLVCERLSAAASRRRFPFFELPPGSEAIYQADGGIVRADRAVAILWRLAAAAGAEMRSGVRVREIDLSRERITVSCVSGERFEASSAILAAGGWTSGLLAGTGLDLPLTVTQELVAYFPPSGDLDHGVGSMPTLIDFHDEERPFYALPQIETPGVKVGWHHAGAEVDPEQPREIDPEALAALCRFVTERFPHLGSEPIARTSCLYTNTPDYHFVLDRHPRHPRLVMGAGLSGHGFKFAPVLGEILAALVLDEPPPLDLSLFSLSRFSRRQPL